MTTPSNQDRERAEAVARTLAFSQQAIVAITDAILEARAEEAERFAENARVHPVAQLECGCEQCRANRRAIELRAQKSSGREGR